MPTQEQIQIANSYHGLTPAARVQLLNTAQRVSFKYEPVQHSVDIEKRRVTTPVITAYTMNLNGWRVLPEEMEDALDSYMARWQMVGRMHTGVTNSYPLRAWSDGWQTYLTIQVVDDEDWRNITDGVYKGTSWAGMANAVDIPEELAAELGIAPGIWLFDIEMMEDSFVDVPAVQAATFNAVATPDDTSLVEQLSSGVVKPRVRGGGMPKEKERHGNGLLGALQQFIQLVNQTVLPHDMEQTISSEDTDMGMTPEEQAKLDQLSQTVETLAVSFADFVKAQNAANESEDAPALYELKSYGEDGKPIVVALEAAASEAAPALTLDDINASIANAVAPLLEKITALENAPAPSAKLREDASATVAQEEPVSSLRWDDPKRLAVTGGK
jgi:hypothetical protein